MNKELTFTLIISTLFILVACTNKYVCSNGATVSDPSLCPQNNELEDLRQEVDQLKLREKAKELVGRYGGDCSAMGSDMECPGQGDWLQVESSIECRYGCENYQCIAKECRVR